MSFRDIALPLAARGIPVIPVQPREKRCVLPAWQELATTSTAQIQAWDRDNPEFNVGCVGKFNGIAILDCDVKGLVSRIEAETGQKIPATLVVRSAGKGCAHVYLRHTDRSRRLGNRVAKELFDLKANNAYVVGPGSKLGVNGSTVTYDIFRDAPFADFPDWLADWIENNSIAEKPRSAARNIATTAIDFDIHDLLNHYGLDYEVNGDWYVTSICPIAGHRHEQSTETGFFYDGSKFGFHCFAATCPGSSMTIGQVLKFLNSPPGKVAIAPYTGPIWPDKPQPTALTTAAPAPAPEPKDTPYPLSIWSGTAYEEFAEICQRGNFIPAEFFIEAIKTVTGAVVSNALTAPLLEGGIPRFYTVLMTAGGGGKGTAIKYACSVFRRNGCNEQPLLWSPSMKIEEVKWEGNSLGACVTAFSSSPGMQRTLEKGHTRWLQIHEELSSIIESTGVEGSGQGLLAANRQLYDGEHFTTTATAKRDACAGMAQNSILAGTTPELWEDMFSGKRIEGSGLFQRFNLVATEQPQRVGTLLTPDLEDFSNNLIARVSGLLAEPCRLRVSPEGLELMNSWFAKLAAPGLDGAEPDPDEYGRLNVLAWRNAIHLAWLRAQTEIRLKDVEAAIRLSDYQLAVRKKHKPAPGETRYALLEGKIAKLVQEKGRVKEREAYRSLHANRYGLGVWNGALKNIQTAGWVEYAKEESNKGHVVYWLVAKDGSPCR